MENKLLTLGEKAVKVLEFYDPSEVHISAYLTNISKMFKNNALIWDRPFPRKSVTKEKDQVPVYGAEHLQEVSTIRHDKSPSNGVARHLGTAIEYACIKHALHDDVSPDERSNADPPINADIDATEFITSLIELAMEFEAYSLITTTAGYASSSHYKTLAAGEQWDNYNSADSQPLKDLDDAKKQIWNARGKKANMVIIPYPVALKLSRHPDLTEIVKYTHSDLLTDGGLPRILKGMTVVEADAIKNTTMQGQTMALSGLWGDYVWIGYVNLAMGLKDTTWGLTFDRGGRIARQWHENNMNADRIEIEEQGYDIKIFDNACGYLLIDTIA